MKYLLIALLMGFSTISTAQKFEKIQAKIETEAKEWSATESNEIYLTHVVEVNGASKTDLFVRAESFIAKTYNNAKNVTEGKDKEEGYILTKGLLSITLMSLGTPVELKVQHLLRIDVKEGKARIVFTQIEGSGDGTTLGPMGNLYPFKPTKKEKKVNSIERFNARNFHATHMKAHKLVEDFEAALKSSAGTGSPGDDW